MSAPRFRVGIRTAAGHTHVFKRAPGPTWEDAARHVALMVVKHTPEACPVTILVLIPGGKQ